MDEGGMCIEGLASRMVTSRSPFPKPPLTPKLWIASNYIEKKEALLARQSRLHHTEDKLSCWPCTDIGDGALFFLSMPTSQPLHWHPVVISESFPPLWHP